MNYTEYYNFNYPDRHLTTMKYFPCARREYHQLSDAVLDLRVEPDTTLNVYLNNRKDSSLSTPVPPMESFEIKGGERVAITVAATKYTVGGPTSLEQHS